MEGGFDKFAVPSSLVRLTFYPPRRRRGEEREAEVRRVAASKSSTAIRMPCTEHVSRQGQEEQALPWTVARSDGPGRGASCEVMALRLQGVKGGIEDEEEDENCLVILSLPPCFGGGSVALLAFSAVLPEAWVALVCFCFAPVALPSPPRGRGVISLSLAAIIRATTESATITPATVRPQKADRGILESICKGPLQ